jgi:hypothetical protein
MRNAILTVAAGLAMFLISFGSASAVPVAAPQAGGVYESGALAVQWGHCERLRYKCQHKNERGEEGEGNCRRYREECGGRGDYCERLRYKCEHKSERGEEGEGNCRRYRRECR